MNKPSEQIANLAANNEYARKYPCLKTVIEHIFEHGINTVFWSLVKIKIDDLGIDILVESPKRGNIGDLQYFLVSENNDILREVNIGHYSHRSLLRPKTWFKKWVDSETVDGAIRDLGERAGMLKYVVALDRRSIFDWQLILYKLPDGKFSLSEFITRETDRIRKNAEYITRGM